MTIDPELVTRKLALIARDLDTIETLEAGDPEEFLQDRFKHAVAERVLERIIGRMIDVNYHLITAQGLPPRPIISARS